MAQQRFLSAGEKCEIVLQGAAILAKVNRTAPTSHGYIEANAAWQAWRREQQDERLVDMAIDIQYKTFDRCLSSNEK